MLYLDAENTRRALPMADAVDAMAHAFSGEAETPLRTMVGVSLVMPGRLDDHMAVKVVSSVPGNPAGIVVVFGPDGSPVGIVDGPTLTAIRTGAVCGLATRLLAPDGVSTLAALGAGAMGLDQIEAIRAVRPLERILVWSRDLEKAKALAGRVGGEAVADPDAAVAEADVVSCATPARSPLFRPESVRPGAHLNAVGAFTPEMAELPPEVLHEAFVVVDDRDAAAAEAGDLLQAGRTPDATLRELLEGSATPPAGRTTVFKSVGVAAQDVAAGQRALENAARMGLGIRL
ncbi:MAG: ornithine cyclodeaminase family protein [Acidimicrobiales bacterium]|nr:ornithine cyclodeaminase family protein [Acidimicrobiales bacterium]HLV91339.1 ornithine cyclodeaminase family protein [Acidimicrobiia bacterium]